STSNITIYTLSLHDALPILNLLKIVFFWENLMLILFDNRYIFLVRSFHFKLKNKTTIENIVNQMIMFKILFMRLKSSVVLAFHRSEEHTSELQSRENLVCRL